MDELTASMTPIGRMHTGASSALFLLLIQIRAVSNLGFTVRRVGTELEPRPLASAIHLVPRRRLATARAPVITTALDTPDPSHSDNPNNRQFENALGLSLMPDTPETDSAILFPENVLDNSPHTPPPSRSRNAVTVLPSFPSPSRVPVPVLASGSAPRRPAPASIPLSVETRSRKRSRQETEERQDEAVQTQANEGRRKRRRVHRAPVAGAAPAYKTRSVTRRQGAASSSSS